jgi:hypothetical protein
VDTTSYTSGTFTNPPFVAADRGLRNRCPRTKLRRQQEVRRHCREEEAYRSREPLVFAEWRTRPHVTIAMTTHLPMEPTEVHLHRKEIKLRHACSLKTASGKSTISSTRHAECGLHKLRC